MIERVGADVLDRHGRLRGRAAYHLAGRRVRGGVIGGGGGGGGGGGTSHPHEPAGFTMLRQLTFDQAITTNPLTSCDYYIVSAGGNCSVVVDATSPEGSTNVGQTRFPAGFATGASPGDFQQSVAPFGGGPWRQLYVSVWHWLSNPYYANDGAGANKIWQAQINTADGNASVFEYFAMGGLPPDQNVNQQTIAPGFDLEGIISFNNTVETAVQLAMGNADAPYAFASAVQRGVWNHNEALLVANTHGLQDGSATFWLNGVKYGEYLNMIRFNDDAVPAWQSCDIRPVYGGAGGPVPADQFMRWKNFYVSGHA